MIGRRGFLRSIGAAVIGLSLALRKPEADESYLPPADERGASVSERFIREYDASKDDFVTRFDARYGYGVLNDRAIRIEGA